MAKLTTKKRKKLPAKDFGLPKSKQFPMEDKTHARDAISGASEARNAGHITAAQAAAIDAKARKILNRR